MLVGPVLIHKLIEATPRNLLQYAVEYTIVVLHGLILRRVPKRRQTLGTQKNQCHAPCPPKLNRTAVGLARASTYLSVFQQERRGWPGIGERKRRVLRTAMPGHDGESPLGDALNLHSKPNLDDRVVRDLEEIRRAAGDAIEEREDRKRHRTHCRLRVAAYHRLARVIILLVLVIVA